MGYNVIIASFLLPTTSTPVADFCYYWQQAFRTVGGGILANAIAYAHDKGAVVLVSTGGETETPSDSDPVAYGNYVATWAKTFLMDGVDFDLENIYPVGLGGMGVLCGLCVG